MNKAFQPLRKASGSSPSIIAFDTEDNGTGAPRNFLCACFYDGTKGHVFWEREDARRFMLRSFGRNAILFAHNLAYDLTNLDYPENSIYQIMAGTRMIGGEKKHGERIDKNGTRKWRYKVRFMDTGNFFVGKSIEKLGSMMGYPKLDYDVTKHSGKTIDEIDADERKELAEYCMRDAEICYKVARYLVDLTNSFNTRFRSYTTASLAMRIFRTNFMDDAWVRRPQEINDYERLSYYGGRTEVFDYRVFDDVCYEDITSSYPTAMRHQKFPRPDKYCLFTDIPWDSVKGKEGVSLVRVKVPYMHKPPLPYRRLEDGKLIFPYGEWTAAYTHPELRMAQRYGVEVKECFQSVLYDECFDPFSRFVDVFYDKKETSEGIEREFYKLMLNGLSGKFGEKRNLLMRLKVDEYNICDCDLDLRYCGRICPYCDRIVLEGSYMEETDDNGWATVHGGRLPDPKHTFPILIAYVTAYGRIKLYEERLSRCDAIYCDTDSCVSPVSPGTDIGEGLGKWTTERYQCFTAFAPKFYRYKDGGKDVMKLKGVPKRHEVVYSCPECEHDWPSPRICSCGFDVDATYRRYRFQRPMKLTEAIRRRLCPNEWHTIRKAVSFMDRKRVKLSSGRSKPIEINGASDIQRFDDLLVD